MIFVIVDIVALFSFDCSGIFLVGLDDIVGDLFDKFSLIIPIIIGIEIHFV